MGTCVRRTLVVAPNSSKSTVVKRTRCQLGIIGLEIMFQSPSADEWRQTNFLVSISSWKTMTLKSWVSPHFISSSHKPSGWRSNLWMIVSTFGLYYWCNNSESVRLPFQVAGSMEKTVNLIVGEFTHCWYHLFGLVLSSLAESPVDQNLCPRIVGILWANPRHRLFFFGIQPGWLIWNREAISCTEASPSANCIRIALHVWLANAANTWSKSDGSFI